MFAKKVKNTILITLSYLAGITIVMSLCCVDSLPDNAWGTWFLIVGGCMAWLTVFCTVNKDVFERPCMLEVWIDKKLKSGEAQRKKRKYSKAVENFYVAERSMQHARNQVEELSKVS